MGIKCQIILTPTHEGVYKSGQSVTGILRYELDERTQFDAIVLYLKGKGKCSWSDGVEDATFHHGKEVYVSLQECVIRHKKINKGVYDHHFKYDLPKNIPSSYKDKICTISYKVIAEFSRPGFLTKTNKFDKEITVYGSLESRLTGPTIFGLTKMPFCWSSIGKIDMKVEIEKTLVMPGENINLKYIINNGSDVPVTGVKMKLIKEKTYISDKKFKNTRRKDIDKCAITCSGVKEKSTTSSHCTVPTLPNLHSIHSNIFIREYKLHVTAKLPFPHKDASVEIPVVIGEKMNDEQRYSLESGFVSYPELK